MSLLLCHIQTLIQEVRIIKYVLIATFIFLSDSPSTRKKKYEKNYELFSLWQNDNQKLIGKSPCGSLIN